MNSFPICAAVFCLSASLATAADYALHSFKKLHLEKHYWSEGANFGDLNRDGKPDAISGPYWWEGPAFQKRHEIYPATKVTKTKNLEGKEVEFPGFEGALGGKNAYSTDNFFAFVHDLNGDGWNDVLTYGLPNTPAFLYLNPKGKEQHWERHTVLDHVDNESPTFTDLTGDGKPEIVCNYEGNFGYATPDWKNPTAKWTFHPITSGGNWQRFTHGLGVGDINGDGRLDVMFKEGWLEQPASLAGDPAWKFNKVNFAPASAQMYAYDVNGDGRADVITALAAHGYGLAWHEQLAEKDANGSPKWRSHVFMHKQPDENRYGVAFPELHAVELFDVDGDGLKDIITGNCYWAHGPAVAPGPGEEGVLYWFRLVRNGSQVDWVPHLIDANSGVGRQIGTGDVNGDGRQDLVIGNKLGTFVFVHEAKKTTRQAWEKSQPQVKFASAGDQRLETMSVIVHTARPTGRPAVVQPAPKAKAKAKAAAPAASDAQPNPPPAPGGVLPAGRDGKLLNLDFEKGTLEDWTAEGNAFDKQPMLGDAVNRRRNDMTSKHAGKYWVGTYEIHRDAAQGTLTSKPFKITHPWAAFLLAGGPYEGTRVELVDASDNRVVWKTAGHEGEAFKKTNNAKEDMTPVLLDLRAHQGREIFIRIVDRQDGHWAHLNFDDFKFYAERPQFAAAGASLDARKSLEQAASGKPALRADEVKFAGLSPQEAADAMTLPKGFKAHAFAAEPDVKQPIAFTIDDKGRLWVIENYTYPHRQPEGKGTDRILVLEDTNGDHKFDKRTVFYEGLNMATAIEYGFGGVFVGAAPWLLHIPMKEENGVPKAAGKPEILLEGWAYHDTHETLNSFQWGPDGWLYGCHGVFTHSHVKRPDQKDTERQFINAGIWRYHPTKREFEVFAEGTSNPWGIDFNEYGHCFIEACVIPHFWHVFQGGRYQRQAGQHYTPNFEEARRLVPDYFTQNFGATVAQPDNPYTFRDIKVQPLHPFIYDDIKTHGDHVHYLGERPHAGNNVSDAAGGGHAHAGLMVYLGDSWPAEYRGKIFMNNIHGQRLNMDVAERTGSGYVGKHAPDFANFQDKWSQIINLRHDQDGSVYLIDWYDKQQCHNQKDPSLHDRSNGRIFKIVYNNQKATKVDFTKLSLVELARLQTRANDWHARQARRILTERLDDVHKSWSPASPDAQKNWAAWQKVRDRAFGEVDALLNKQLASDKDTTRRLRALWTLHAIDGLNETALAELLGDIDEHLRSWAIQLLCENKNPSDAALKEFARMAKEDSSPMVRLYLASALQRIAVDKRQPILEGLIAHAEDAKDHNLPLMYWYATEPVVAQNMGKAAILLGKTKIPVLREYITRRMTAASKPVAQTGK
ncbi:MAG: PVC-type heme-binding CxxCH protein [Verrucomicrobiota bacterium]